MPRELRLAFWLAVTLVIVSVVAATHGWALLAAGIVVALYQARKRKLRLSGPSQPRQVRARQPISRKVKAAVWLRDGGRCRHCGMTDAEAVARTGEHLHYDHIVPFSWGGPDTEDNLQLLCQFCNLSKGNRRAG